MALTPRSGFSRLDACNRKAKAERLLYAFSSATAAERTGMKGMMLMTAKEYLQQLQKLDVVINQRIHEKDDLRARLLRIGSADYSKERVKTSRSAGAGYEKQIVKIIDLENEIDSLIDKYVDLKHKVIGEIHNINKADHIKLLYKRYVENKMLEVIADEMSYSYQYIKELHRHALQEFSTTYPNLP